MLSLLDRYHISLTYYQHDLCGVGILFTASIAYGMNRTL